jgi:hypothetical protein
MFIHILRLISCIQSIIIHQDIYRALLFLEPIFNLFITSYLVLVLNFIISIYLILALLFLSLFKQSSLI